MEYSANYKNPHPLFRLNNQRFNARAFRTLAVNYIAEGSKNQAYLGNFISDWLNDSDSISIQTSGTTSNPKVIRLPKVSFINSAIATAAYFGLVAGNSALCCLPFSFTAAKMMFVRSWVSGLKLDVIEPSSSPLENIKANTYDLSAMVPLQLQNSLLNINQIKTLLVGGATVPEGLASKVKGLDTAVFETFGMTETLSHIAAKNLSLGDIFFKVLPGIEIAKDQRGCLVVSAPLINPEKLTTNDVILLPSKSTFLWLGRHDNIINSAGVKIQPEVLEKQLKTQLKNRFFISAIPDDILGQKVVLIIEGEEMKLELDWHQIDPLKRPKVIYFIPNFLETSSGKIQRKKTMDLLNLNQS